MILRLATTTTLAATLALGTLGTRTCGSHPRATSTLDAGDTATRLAALPREALNSIPDAGSPPSPSPARVAPDRVRWIAGGGGAEPELNQISLAQDLALARDTLGPNGVLLFASGPASRVQVLDPAPRGDALLQRLGELFDPRSARDAHYAFAPVAPHAEATAARVIDELRMALVAGDQPLLLFLDAHGDLGDSARDNSVQLWGNSPLGVAPLAALLDQTATRRTVRVVIAACYSGGFAEIAFRDAREAAGASPTARCGLFASLWDREASGCDPDPDRRVHQGYAVHFLHALQGQDRDGTALARADVDYDGNGSVSLLEAHTRARIAGLSIDVPTTTSERWLRSVAPQDTASQPVALPEEDAVIRALVGSLGLHDAREARVRLEQTEAQLESLRTRINDVDDRAHDARSQLAADLLARWPALDDPWHPDWAATVNGSHAAIAAFIEAHPTSIALRELRTQQEALNDPADHLEIQSARLQRLVRAIETRELAGRLAARGGSAWQTYQRLLACERSAP